MVRTIAHEVRNPLGSIRLGTQLLQHTDTVGSGSQVDTDSHQIQLSQNEIQEYTGIIIKEVDRLNRFIEQLLAFSKPAMQLQNIQIFINCLRVASRSADLN